MDISQKKSILSHLASKAEPNSAAFFAIEKHVNDISKKLHKATEYELVSAQLELLDVLSYRVPEKSIAIIDELLYHLMDPKSLQDTSEVSVPELNRILVIKALECLAYIRYYDPDKVLNIFFEYSCVSEESISTKAIRLLELFAAYDMDIVFGNDKGSPSLGVWPQEKILEKMNSFNADRLLLCTKGVIAASQKILAPEIEGSHWNYNSVSIRTCAVPIQANTVREQTLNLLKKLYALVGYVEGKKNILDAMAAATRTPYRGGYSDEVMAMVMKNTIVVLEFMYDFVSSQDEDMQIMQKIEHDAYWFFYHWRKHNEEIGRIALNIKDTLYSHGEYKVFRVLIGFESVFHDWEEESNFDFDHKFRDSEVIKLSQQFNQDTYDIWSNRIVSYANIKSNDAATFPYLGKFLECFGRASPDLALRFLSDFEGEIFLFQIPLLCGISKTDKKDDVERILNIWCDKQIYLSNVVRYFEVSNQINKSIMERVFEIGKANGDLNLLAQVISSVSAVYKAEDKYLISTLLIPCIEFFSEKLNASWVSVFWFRKNSKVIFSDMNHSDRAIVIENLIFLEKIDYQSEEILLGISKYSPDLVLEFLCNRLSRDNVGQSNYEAIPYNFHKLSDALSSFPEQAVDSVLKLYKGDYHFFIYRGAKLLKNIFVKFEPEFERKLIELVRSGIEDNLWFVMAILRNFDGSSAINNVCRELIIAIESKKDLLNELRIVLQSTGVVSGEYGFVDAYNKKIEEISGWLNDENENVQQFAEGFIEVTKKQIEYERKRADEDIILRKHLYGGDD